MIQTMTNELLNICWRERRADWPSMDEATREKVEERLSERQRLTHKIMNMLDEYGFETSVFNSGASQVMRALGELDLPEVAE